MAKWFLDRIEKRRDAFLKRLGIYSFAVVLPGFALLAKHEISPVFEHGRYFLHFAAVVIVSLYGGIGPGIVAILVSSLGSYLFFLKPNYPFSAEQQHSYFLLMLFTAVSLLTSVVAAKLRQSMHVAGREKKKAEDAVIARSELMAVVSHDLKNPLAAILLRRQILLRSLDRGEADLVAIRRLVDSMGSSAEQMNRLIQDILDMDTIETGHLKIELKSEDLQDILKCATELFSPIAEIKTIQLVIPPLSIPVKVHCDRSRVLQVLSNLIGNAIKFTAEGGRVEVGTQLVSRGKVEIYVRDNGPGIRSEHLDKLFDRHWQAEGTARLGQGLGLFITKGIIEAHQGTIWVESTLGRGSVFHFTLARSPALSEPVLAELLKSKKDGS